jgi:hypothetical protein
MALLDFFSTTFLIHLAITVLIIGTVSIYFMQKINVQNHKINSMLELVSTMAEELKRTQSMLTIGSSVPLSFGASNYPVSSNMPFSEVIQLGGEEKDLINVSDDEGEDDDDEEDEDDEDDEEDEDEEDDEDDDEDDDDEDEDDEDEEKNIKTINIGETILDMDLNEVEPEEKPEAEAELEELTKTNFNLEDLEPKSIDILDYKKLSLNKLKSIIVEKGIVTDASKLKKNDILKLLEVE